ncbi:MAG TPA: DNA primase small subunit domain-containing protein, partial [Candidatus Paceibacterota bacterium]|nr:DNA primase small subunit domain-containing protein [Candidatus Paceibacterota bacterium]
MPEEKSLNEQRIRKITQLYYTRKDIQKVIFDFSKNREISPRYFEGFGKRPDSFQYLGDIFELVKKGATSFHCSEELWEDPFKIQTGMDEKQINNLRIGWDLLIDVDSKYIDYSKISAELIIKILNFHGVKNIGIKFSGNKGFHIIVPWKAFPKDINHVKTSNMFPEWPRIISLYITEKIKPALIEKVSDLTKPNKYVKDFKAPEEVMPDIILVSPRHLFRMPYSLHEKTALASVVLDPDEIADFQLKDANPMKVKIKNFMPDPKEGEASELLIQALDWYNQTDKTEKKERREEYKPIKIENLSENNFSPSIRKILQGVDDGRKRSLFILINLFRSLGMEKDEFEKRIYGWNKKNKIPLKEGYIKSQLIWSYRNKIVPPPNFDKDYYKGIGIIP